MSEITLPTLPSRAEPRSTPEAPPARKKRPARKVKARKAKKRVAQAPKSPNRPLENKNKLHAVLALTADLRRAEMVTFASVVETMEGMSRGARRRVLEALGRVYT